MISNLYRNDDVAFWHMSYVAQIAADSIKDKIKTSKWGSLSRICCLCKKENVKILSEKNKYGIIQRIVICKNCGLIYWANGIDQDATNNFYRDYYLNLCVGNMDVKEIFSYQYQRGKNILNFLLEHNINNPKKVLEIGCGTAGISFALKEQYKNCDFYGLDYRDEDIEFSKGNKISIFKYTDSIYADLKKYNFDLIIANHVVEHFVDLENELLKIKSIMSKDTILFIGVPGVLSTYKYYNYFLESVSLDHNYYFTATTLNNIMITLGFNPYFADQDIQALYRIADAPSNINSITNDYVNIMRYIEDNEPDRYKIYCLKIRLKNFLRRLLKWKQ